MFFRNETTFTRIKSSRASQFDKRSREKRVLKKKQASSLLNFLKSTKNSSNKYYLVDFIFCLELWPTLFTFLRVNEVPEDDLEFLAKQVQL